jgi:hypothetical protein
LDPMVIASVIYAGWCSVYWCRYFFKYEPPGLGELEDAWIKIHTFGGNTFAKGNPADLATKDLFETLSTYRFADTKGRWPFSIRAFATMVRPRGRLVLRGLSC